MGQPACIDDRALDRLRRQGGPVLVREIVKIFLEDAPLRLRDGRAGVAARNLDATRRAAHSLKSTAGALGAVELKSISERIEQFAGAEDAPAAAALLDAWDTAFAEAARRLSVMAEGGDAPAGDGGEGPAGAPSHGSPSGAVPGSRHGKRGGRV
jgi:HPt (histidine-containing phosphotransfer) domain-containing protein